jgi:hypothetical protein
MNNAAEVRYKPNMQDVIKLFVSNHAVVGSGYYPEFCDL